MQHTIDQNINEIDPKHPKLYIFQSRVTMDYEKVHDYAQKMKDGTRFNPIEAFIDENDNVWGYNGKHRQEAAIEAGVMLPVTITPGTENEAELEALGANFDNGLPRSKADEEWAVELGFTKHLLSEREVSRRTKLSRRRVGNIKKDLIAAGKIPADYKPTVKRGDSEYVQNTEKIGTTRKLSERQPLSGSGVPDTQTAFDGLETYFTVPELQSFVRTYCTGDRKERLNYLQNLSMATIAGRAYLRELESSLQHDGRQSAKKYRKNELMQAIKNLQEELEALACAGPGCDFQGKEAQMFFLNNKWYCSRCAENVQEKLTMPTEEGDPSVLDNLIMQRLDTMPEDIRLESLRELMLSGQAADNLARQITGFPPKEIRKRCRILYERLSKAPRSQPEQPVIPDRKEKPFAAKCESCGANLPNKPLVELMGKDENFLCDACRQQATIVFQEASHKTEEGTYYSGAGITVNDLGERFGQTTYVGIEDRTAFDAINLAETQSEKVDTKDVVYGKNRIIFQFWKSHE